MNHYDVIIIGSGAGGGTLAHRLAPSGKRVLILERGDYLRREPDNWSSRAVNVEAKYHTREVWSDRKGRPLHPHTHYYVGGNTKFYGAALFRLRREDFGEVRHEDGISPGWPITYEDMEPYYTIAERLYHVHGERGADPTEPPASAPYPHPPITHEPRIQQLHDSLERQGLHPFHVPLGVMLDEQSPRTSKCIRCATCDGYGCIVNAKSDAQVICVDPALEHPNVGKLDAIALSAGAPAIVPNLTLDVLAKHSLDFWLTSEDLPDANNRVTLDRNGGIVLQYTPNNVAAHRKLIDRLHQIVIGCDCTQLVPRQLWVGQRIPLAGVAHQNGTCRFGHDPASSVLDVNCRTHDVDNLYVVDASFFPSSAAVNPALTVMANALRVGDHLLDRLGALVPGSTAVAPSAHDMAIAGG